MVMLMMMLQCLVMPGGEWGVRNVMADNLAIAMLSWQCTRKEDNGKTIATTGTPIMVTPAMEMGTIRCDDVVAVLGVLKACDQYSILGLMIKVSFNGQWHSRQ